jgi:acetylornithine deacetylase/succinyl-diaminopimelate desuccinylase-like protein
MLHLRILFIGLWLNSALGTAQADSLDPELDSFRELYRELVEINTTLSSGSCTRAAEAMAAHLRTSGIPERDLHMIVPPEWPTQGNLVAHLPGYDDEQQPLLLLAHIDVVEANPDDWERDPFTLIEEDGYFYGRGTADDKAMAAIFTDALIHMKQTGFHPKRTIKLALTCGEETPGEFNGVSYLLEHHRDLIDAQFALNEGAFAVAGPNGQKIFNGIQAGEKTYQDYQLEIRNPGGHSSRPVPDNAINRLAAALTRIAEYQFPITFNDTTRAYFTRMAKLSGGQTGQDMLAILQESPDPDALARITADAGFNSMLHTTCVATMLDAGHAPNALPQRARANVNCRIFPGQTQEQVRQVLSEVANDTNIAITFADPPESTSPPPPLTPEIVGPMETVSKQMWPQVPVIPFMQAGGTDGRLLTPAGIPTYSISGMFADPNTMNIHGLNERIPVPSLYESREFLNRLIRLYAGGE